MKKAFIMRGIPGSGKSTVARYLAGKNGAIHSTDQLRYNSQGEYVFDPEKNAAQHEQNFHNFCRSLRRGVEIVVCDNTNIRRSDFAHYIEAARDAGYLVTVVSVEPPNIDTAVARNTHGVDRATIESMLKCWEP